MACRLELRHRSLRTELWYEMVCLNLDQKTSDGKRKVARTTVEK